MCFLLDNNNKKILDKIEFVCLLYNGYVVSSFKVKDWKRKVVVSSLLGLWLGGSFLIEARISSRT